MSRTIRRYGRTVARLALEAIALTLTLATALALPTPAGASHPVNVFPATGFGGYRWWGGPVSQISARWRVPRILPGSSDGDASTWIGAEDRLGGPPFIQLGTIENLSQGQVLQYQAFWSDTTVGFHPRVILNVDPGDEVMADMARSTKGWTLTFKDESRSAAKSVFIPYGVGGTFSQGEWLQEDPTASQTAALDIPYPKMSTVGFTDLLVDHRPPHLRLANAQVLLARGGTFLEPSPVDADAFSFGPPKGAAESYLRGASTLDSALSTFDVDLLHWSRRPVHQKEALARGLARAEGAFASTLSAESLPRAAGHDATLVEQRSRRIKHDLSQWAASGCRLSGARYAQLHSDLDVAPLADQMRASLAIPPT